MAILKWERPSGTTIETNDTQASIDAAVALGWVPAKVPVKKPVKKKK
jgi:hypothetical protein